MEEEEVEKEKVDKAKEQEKEQGFVAKMGNHDQHADAGDGDGGTEMVEIMQDAGLQELDLEQEQVLQQEDSTNQEQEEAESKNLEPSKPPVAKRSNLLEVVKESSGIRAEEPTNSTTENAVTTEQVKTTEITTEPVITTATPKNNPYVYTLVTNGVQNCYAELVEVFLLREQSAPPESLIIFINLFFFVRRVLLLF